MQQNINLLSVNRRDFFQRAGFNMGAIALSMLMGKSKCSALDRKLKVPSIDNPLASTPGHFPSKVKNIIYLHMIGAPSHIDLFDHKPILEKYDGKDCPKKWTDGRRFAFIGDKMKLSASPYKFKPKGEAGHAISELLPHLSHVTDDITFIKSMHTEEINHAPAQMFLHTGFGRGGRPSFGSWVTYGLGTENENMPGYVVLLSGALAGAGTSLWSTGFLPSVYQGIQFRSKGDPVLFLSNPKGHTDKDRRRLIDAVKEMNELQYQQAGDDEILTRISQYEMAYAMQASVPELMNIAGETKQTLEMYGAKPGEASFANNCLLARRLVEKGVRVVQLFDSDWDHHSNLDSRIRRKCKDVDQGMAALIADLKQRGMLDETLIIFGAEFGRTPIQQGSSSSGKKTKMGRDHNKDAFTVWLAGGGIKPGLSYGKTDEIGFGVADKPVHVHDLNATVLHLLGMDHEKLTYRYQGREFRLTDIHGEVVHDILS